MEEGRPETSGGDAQTAVPPAAESVPPHAETISTAPANEASSKPANEDAGNQPDFARSKSKGPAAYYADTNSEEGDDAEAEPEQEVLVTLLEAVETGSLEHLRAGIERRADLEESSEAFGDTPL